MISFVNSHTNATRFGGICERLNQYLPLGDLQGGNLGIWGSGAQAGFRFLVWVLEFTDFQHHSRSEYLSAFQGGNMGVGRTGATDHLFGEVHFASQQAHSSQILTTNAFFYCTDKRIS